MLVLSRSIDKVSVKPLRYAVTLPFPPSVNRIWKYVGTRVIRDPDYQAWINAGYGAVFEQCGVPGRRRPIQGSYRLELTLDVRKFGIVDQDNCLKAVSDLLQRTRLIANDKNAWETKLLWGDVESSHPDTFACLVGVEEIAGLFD